MKRAIGYIRISDKDQAHFSPEGQEKFIREYCDRKGFLLVNVFIEKQSAKDFDRRAWKNLEEFIKINYREIDYLIVIKYDRFSRNTAQGLLKIEMIERKFNIVIMSVFEELAIDAESPFYFKQRADILVNAEFELRVIRDRTRFCMHVAISTGRYISKAPIGYLNKRDAENKPILVIDEERAFAIRKIFKLYLQGIGIKAIVQELRLNDNFTLKGNSAITNILSNSVYAGLVRVPPYKEKKEKLIKGLRQL